jgi:hypothetical protein
MLGIAGQAVFIAMLVFIVLNPDGEFTLIIGYGKPGGVQ